MNLADLRKSYTLGGLDEAAAGSDPIRLFQIWFQAAVEAGLPEPNAMTLATCTPTGSPSARVVLLKNVDEAGFTFFTNFESRKGSELQANPAAALVFLWHEFERQVRIEGVAEPITDAESADYFATRPRGSQLGAWVSRQSAVIAGRAELEAELAAVAERFPDVVPRPPFWGGFRVRPAAIEFWQGRPNRLHDRIRFRRVAADWVRERLSP